MIWLIVVFGISTSIFWLPLGGCYYFLGKSKSEGIAFLRTMLAIFFMFSPIWLPLVCAEGILWLKSFSIISKDSSVKDLFVSLGTAAPMIGAIPIVLNSNNSVVLKIILSILYWCVITLPFFFIGWMSLVKVSGP